MKIYRYSNEVEAQKIKFLFEDENVPCEIHSFENWGYDGMFRGQMGMGEIIVPDGFSDKARKIIDKFVKEEREKENKEDNELRILKLESVAKQEKFYKPSYVISIIFGILLLLKFKGIASIVIFGGSFIIILPLILVLGEKEAEKARKELQNLKNEEVISKKNLPKI
jgi:hypothetical protein